MQSAFFAPLRPLAHNIRYYSGRRRMAFFLRRFVRGEARPPPPPPPPPPEMEWIEMREGGGEEDLLLRRPLPSPPPEEEGERRGEGGGLPPVVVLVLHGPFRRVNVAHYTCEKFGKSPVALFLEMHLYTVGTLSSVGYYVGGLGGIHLAMKYLAKCTSATAREKGGRGREGT